MGDLFGASILNLPYYDFIESNLDGIPLVITRTGWTGEVGYEIFLCDPKRGVELWEKILQVGRRYKIAPTGPSDIRRIEAGILNYGADITLTENPYEVGLGWLVDLEKRDDFIGKESLQRIKSQGVRRKLVGVEIGGRPIEFNMTRWPARNGGGDVCYVTSAIYSPRLKQISATRCCPSNTRVGLSSR
jgi:aminomethyltransferase